MKCNFLRPLKRLQVFPVLMLACIAAPAQNALQAQKPINLDKELEGQVATDRAASYYHFSLAKWYESNGDQVKALSEMQTALKYNQNSVAVHLELAALLLEKTGNIREAVEHAEEAIRLDPQDPDPHWLLANIYFRPQQRGKAATESIQKAVRELEKLRELTPQDERIYYALGGAYLQLDEPEKAIEAYEKFQEGDTGSDSGYREIARYYDRKGDYSKAIEYLNKGLKIQPDSSESLLMLGSIYTRNGQSKEAIPVYKKLLEATKNNPAVKRQLAASFIEAGEYNEAISILKDLADATPSEPAAMILLGRAQIGARKLPEAIKTLQLIEAEDSGANENQRTEARFYLGVAYEESRKYAEAAKIFSDLLDDLGPNPEEKNANYAVFQQHLAANYLEMRSFEKAIALYQEIAKADPKANLQLLNAYRISRLFDKAISFGKQLFEKDPNDVQIGVVYARTLADAGRAKEGAEILSGLLQSNHQNADIYVNLVVNLSQVYLQDKRYADAERVVRGAENRKLGGESNERLRFQLAEVYERQKDFERAESIFKEILKTNPNNAEVLNYIGYMLADRGVRLEEAVRYVKEALVIDPNNGAYLDSLGWAFFKLNDLKNAEIYLLEADELVGNDPTIDEHLGDLYFKTGNLEKAKSFWMSSVKIGTVLEDIQKVRRKLEMLQETLQKQKPGK
jgi:tetratricopeptide (TPR) repeat protein